MIKNIPVSKLKNECWKPYVNDTRIALHLEDECFRTLTNNHLNVWFKKFQMEAEVKDNWNQSAITGALFDDKRKFNSNSPKIAIPNEVKEGVKTFVTELIAQRIEINLGILQPFIHDFVKNEFKDGAFHYLLEPKEDGETKFKLSRSWLRRILKDTKLSYQKITNDAGKLPDNWRDKQERFYIRVAYIIGVHNITRSCVLNMDETPLPWYATTGHTWAPTNVPNVSTQGSKDKRQATGTPWITAEGKVPFFHITVKGKTKKCLPNAAFRNKSRFTGEEVCRPEILFGFSQNHWVSKETMLQQVEKVEEYRVKISNEEGLGDDCKLLILWDVYCRHRDHDLLSTMKDKYPHLLVLFIPANLTELCQPLDIYFNATFKTKMSALMGTHRVEEYNKWKREEAKRKEDEGDNFEPSGFKLKTKLSETKELFYTTVSDALKQMLDDGGHKNLSANVFKHLNKCFDHQFQFEAAQKVSSDNEGVYFKRCQQNEGNGRVSASQFTLIDSALEQFASSSMYDASSKHQEIPCNADDEIQSNNQKFVDRLVKDLDGKYPGKVVKAVKNRCSSKYVFEVKYYRNIIGIGRAIKVVKCDWSELMSLLVVSDDHVQQENAEDEDVECSNDSLDEDNGDVNENNVGDHDNEDNNEDD